VYGGSPDRGVEFAAEAVAGAEVAGDPALLAEALDAQLLVHWGPDDLASDCGSPHVWRTPSRTSPTSKRA